MSCNCSNLASTTTFPTQVKASKSEKGSILGGLSEVTRMVPGATIKGTAGLEIDFSNTWRYLKYLLNPLGQRHRDTPIQQLLAHLSKLIRWWCWPPAFPQPPGCLRCLPIRPWPFAKQPCKACIDRILKELHKMWLSSSKLWTLASLSVAVHLTALPQMGHHLASELPHWVEPCQTDLHDFQSAKYTASPLYPLLPSHTAVQPWPTRGKQNLNLKNATAKKWKFIWLSTPHSLHFLNCLLKKKRPFQFISS